MHESIDSTTEKELEILDRKKTPKSVQTCVENNNLFIQIH